MKNKNKIGICAICGKKDKLTKDHIPPKNIFLNPRPKNTITVDTCIKCNKESDLDDEYFRIWIAGGGEHNSKLGQLWKDKVVKSSFRRSPTLQKKLLDDRLRLLEHHKKEPLRTFNNEIIPDEMLDRTFMLEAERIISIVKKIVKGLFFYHYKRPMPSYIKFEINYEPIDKSTIKRVIIERKGMVGGEEGEFIYWFNFINERYYESEWILLFYLCKNFNIVTRITWYRKLIILMIYLLRIYLLKINRILNLPNPHST